MLFQNRFHAGSLLAGRLGHLRETDAVVLALPRGGVTIGEPIAKYLHAPLDVLIVRKLGVPFHPELAMGAIGEAGVIVLEDSVVSATRVTSREIQEVERRELALLEERIVEYRNWRPEVPLDGRMAVIVDDGMATGATMRAACQVLATRGVRAITVAVPVAAPEAVRRLQAMSEVVCLHSPARFEAIGAFYADFSPVADREVKRILLDRPSAS